MAEVTITSPNPAYAGRSAGVQFSDGKAVIDDGRTAALEYFQRHGFGISKSVKADDPELSIEKRDVPAGARTGAAGKAEAKAAAKSTEKTGGKAEAKGEPVKGAGDGPVGPQHNQGHDGADPSNTGVPTIAPNGEAGI